MISTKLYILQDFTKNKFNTISSIHLKVPARRNRVNTPLLKQLPPPQTSVTGVKHLIKALLHAYLLNLFRCLGLPHLYERRNPGLHCNRTID